MSEMRLAVMGAAGRMGRALIRAVHESPQSTLVGGTEAAGSEAIGKDLGELAGVGALGIHVTDDPLELFTRCEGILDFTSPNATAEYAGLAAQGRIVHVIGTTGFGESDEQRIASASRHATIVKAGNMSLGVNLLTALTEKVAAALDQDYDIEIVEMHHRYKVDAPSGTALMLGEAAASGRQVALSEHAVKAREGHTGPRQSGDIGFATLRGGDVVGEHTVVFAGQGERVELTHRATDRQIFARGAVKAALWARGKPPGIYSMRDVLGL
ncbi:4-hydroxy-tetrahydrodipicolinate reductase [Dichotomicrobium thermohalophilum]|uniref:4-hydroxy-tetrahydrodipicolinate reductase n=1 Tax=Dichotomicrobium thermohalophilum TaxID=933063 RepID=A0A397PEB3_9HYPH|nr:4-hydroxy-tetrahydrodipicolinate reductase [Dichotomicrobium thermohalophilum]RIA47298.1 dihydrodipicolinate reductase [Dichotomicrobium thermohalophilum]